MKYSYNWLKELSQTKSSSEKVVENLTMHSLEVEGLEKMGREFENVVVGKILEIEKHPNADKLQITKIDVGTNNHLSIVCGASNIEVGQKVPVALIGAKMLGGFEIKEAELRGVKSCGMLCAADELGLGTDHSGIMILDPKAKIGTPLAKYLELDDSILEIKVLPDRAHDCLSHVGLAREITVLERRVMDYDFDGLILPKAKSKMLSVEIKDKDLCRRYIGAVMTGIEIKESPAWMKARLKSCGIKSINNVVDATNYVMLELGQPLHAFDLNKIATKSELSSVDTELSSDLARVNIVVRRAKDKEKLTLLDDSQIELNNSDLLITNGETPLALAGIMGGKDSGIYDDTKTIVLEAASFDAVNIRRTRTRLNIKTESSDRYEKDIDPNMTEKAMMRVIEIIEHIADGQLEGLVDVYPNKVSQWKIKLDLNYVNNLLGEIVPEKDVVKMLNLLRVKTVKRGSTSLDHNGHKRSNLSLECTIPTFRVDLKTQEDLIEEIGRVWGYENIKPRPIMEEATPVHVNEQLKLERKVREKMIGFGFDEVYNYSFYSQQDAINCGLDSLNHLELANPMNPDQQLVRVSLVSNILKNVRENLKHFSDFGIFEVGRTYVLNNNSLQENRSIVMAQVVKDPAKSAGADRGASAETFYELKGSVEDLLESFGINGGSTSIMEVEPPLELLMHSTRTAKIMIGNIAIGMIGEINPLVLEKYKIKSRVAMAEIDAEKLLSVLPKVKLYSPISKFPVVTRDISMLADAKTKVADIIKSIKNAGGNLVLDVELFDIFKKENQNSFAFHISFGFSERTLESKEIDELMDRIISGLEKELKMEIRK